MTRRARPGMTLMEVVLSTVIFMISATAIYYLSSLGGERALDIYDQTKASLLCQSKLAEIVAGAEPLASGGGYGPFPNDSDKDYEWRMEAAESDVPSLWDVKIWVRHERPGGQFIQAHLCQKVLDPTMRGSTFDQPNTGTTTSQAGGTSGSGTTPSSTGGN
jgi:general secretion pathway protein I